jgi:hypothetical protein
MPNRFMQKPAHCHVPLKYRVSALRYIENVQLYFILRIRSILHEAKTLVKLSLYATNCCIVLSW